MSRSAAVALFGAELVAEAMRAPAERAPTILVRDWARFCERHACSSLPSFRVAVGAHLAPLPPSERLALVRLVVGGSVLELAAVDAEEKRAHLH